MSQFVSEILRLEIERQRIITHWIRLRGRTDYVLSDAEAATYGDNVAECERRLEEIQAKLVLLRSMGQF
jgi:hypothetical protein